MQGIWRLARFFWAVCVHKAFMLQECYRAGITWRGIWHDCSKFRLSEWIWVWRGDMDKARIIHANRNRHHQAPVYWADLVERAMDMRACKRAKEWLG
jgi:hypothetical protein